MLQIKYITHLNIKYLKFRVKLGIILSFVVAHIPTSVIVLNPVWTVSLYDKLDGVYRRQRSIVLSFVHTLFESLSDPNVN